MLEDEAFDEFYTRINDLRNSMVSLGKMVSGVKLIRKILRSLPKCFRIKFTTIEESKDLESMKIEELVRSLQTYEYFLPPVKKTKAISLKASKKKARVSYEKDSDNEEDAMAMLAKNFWRLMKNLSQKKDPRGPRCFECSGFGHIRVDYGNLKQTKGEAYNATLNDESEE